LTAAEARSKKTTVRSRATGCRGDEKIISTWGGVTERKGSSGGGSLPSFVYRIVLSSELRAYSFCREGEQLYHRNEDLREKRRRR